MAAVRTDAASQYYCFEVSLAQNLGGLVRCLEPWKNRTHQSSKSSGYRANLLGHDAVLLLHTVAALSSKAKQLCVSKQYVGRVSRASLRERLCRRQQGTGRLCDSSGAERYLAVAAK